MNTLTTATLTVCFALVLGLSHKLDAAPQEWEDAQRTADMVADLAALARAEQRVERAYLALCQQQLGPTAYVEPTLNTGFECRRQAAPERVVFHVHQ